MEKRWGKGGNRNAVVGIRSDTSLSISFYVVIFIIVMLIYLNK